MGKITKSIIYPALAVIFMLLMTDFVSYNLISHNNIILHCECPDFTKHSEHSHANHFEEIPYIESITKSYKSDILKDFLLFTNPNFRSRFYSEIWQPPKNS